MVRWSRDRFWLASLLLAGFRRYSWSGDLANRARDLLGTCAARGLRGGLLLAAETAAYELRNDVSFYRRWIARVEPPSASAGSDTVLILLHIDAVTQNARRAVESVQRQSHVQWRLLLVVDGCGHCAEAAELLAGEARATLASAAADDRRSDVLSVAPETDFVLFMDADCCLSPQALSAMLRHSRETGADVVYPDEDLIVGGERRLPVLKPGFSIDLFRAVDYVGPVVLFRCAVLRAAEGAPAHDPFAHTLSAFERGASIRRVPAVLAHWQAPRDVQLSPAQRRLVSTHLLRTYREPLAGWLDASAQGASRVRFPGLATIVIPTRDRIDLLERCIASIYASRSNVEFEVIVLDNRSEDPASKDWLARAETIYSGLRVIRADYPFNWSRLNNQGIAEARGDVLVFLNNDTEAITEGWLDRLVVQSRRSDVGSVGTLLLYPDGSIQHAGIVVGIGGVADHVYARAPGLVEDRHVYVSPYLPRNVLACTGACLAIERAVLERFGEFDERFRVCGDLEMGVRLHKAGLLNVYDPDVRLVHHESATRPKVPLDQQELAHLAPVIGDLVAAGDPYYHPNLTRMLRYPIFEWHA